MASNKPFNFSEFGFVPPIVCVECGANAHCVRRVPDGREEHQTFQCSECRRVVHRTVGDQESDAVIQKSAEELCGRQKRSSAKRPDSG